MRKLASQPRYLQLAGHMRHQIEDGLFKPGDRLPSEAELCSGHGVSRGTVVRAIEQLVADGIVHRRQGVGSFVARPSLHRRTANLLSFTESAAGEGMRSEQGLISFGPATPVQIQEFDCDGPAVSLCRLRYVDGLPCAIHRSLVPLHVARRIDALNGEDEAALKESDFSLYSAFEVAGYRVCEASERVTTRLANTEEAALLNFKGPAAVMVVFRKSFDVTGRLVEAVEAVYLSGFYTYDMNLVSASGGRAVHAQPNVLSMGGYLSKSLKGKK